jgi:small subunit ribosomal protein S17
MTDAENTDNIDEIDEIDEAPETAAAAPPADAEPAAPVADEEPAEDLGPKQRRKRARSTHSGQASAAKTVEERIAERVERRRKKAVERRAWRVKSRERRRASSSGEGTPPAEKQTTGSPRVLRGVVVSDKADKTITVRIDTARPHRTYKKIVRSSSTLHAHDESNEANAGDTVRVVESRPLSRSKRWRLVEVVERAR